MTATTVQTKDDTVVVYFSDERILNSQRIESIGDELREAVAQASSNRLVLNFRGVTFMSSAMITKLIMLQRVCSQQGVGLKFCEVSQNVMDVFRLTRLVNLFDIRDSESEAIRSFDLPDE